MLYFEKTYVVSYILNIQHLIYIFLFIFFLFFYFIKIIFNKFNLYLIDKENKYLPFFSFMLFLWISCFCFYFILGFILNFQWDDSYIISSDIFCEIYKVLTKEQQYCFFHELLSRVDQTRYDLRYINYDLAEPYLSQFTHPLKFRFESLRFIHTFQLDLSQENPFRKSYKDTLNFFPCIFFCQSSKFSIFKKYISFWTFIKS